MKAMDLKVKVFHCLLALMLVMGLMVPSLSTVAYGDPAVSQPEPAAIGDVMQPDSDSAGESLPESDMDQTQEGLDALADEVPGDADAEASGNMAGSTSDEPEAEDEDASSDDGVKEGGRRRTA